MRRALTFAAPYRRSVIAIVILTLGLTLVNAADPLVLKYIFDALTENRGRNPLVRGIATLLAVGLLREALAGVSNWLTWRARLGIHYRLLEATVARLHRMPLQVQRSEGVGAILTRLDRNIQGFIGALTQLAFNVFPALTNSGNGWGDEHPWSGIAAPGFMTGKTARD
jgi:ATP-binding cassette subfamily B protein